MNNIKKYEKSAIAAMAINAIKHLAFQARNGNMLITYNRLFFLPQFGRAFSLIFTCSCYILLLIHEYISHVMHVKPESFQMLK